VCDCFFPVLAHSASHSASPVSGCLSVFTFMTLVLDAWSCAVVRSPSVSFFRLPDAQFMPRCFSQQLLASFPGGTVHHAVSSSNYPSDRVLACVCAGCQSHRSGQSTSLVAFSSFSSLESTYLLRLCSSMFTVY